MLQAIRDRAQTWLAWVIVILICIPFALWGIQEYLGTGAVPNVAVVDGEEISISEYQSTYQDYREQQRARLTQMLGNNTNHPLFKQLLDEQRLKQQVIDSLVENRVLVKAAYERGLRVGEERVNEYIRSLPAFQREGRFDAEAFEQQLRYRGMSTQGFKTRLANDLIVNHMLLGVSASAIVPDQDVNTALRISNQTREAGYLTVSAAPFAEQVEVDDAKIEAYYRDNPDPFRSTEQVLVEYLELDAKEIAAKLDVSEEELRRHYERNIDEYRVDIALLKAQEVAAKLAAGEAFEALARTYSKDPGSAEQGGDLGYFGRNVMDPAFEKAVFAMKEGEISEPVRTTFGYHIINLTGIKDDERRASHILLTAESGGEEAVPLKPFDEVRAAVEKSYRGRQAEEQFLEQFDLLNNLSYENPGTLMVAAEQLGLPVKELGPFARSGGSGLAGNPALVSAAFSADVLEGGNNSELIELGESHVVVLRVKRHDVAAVKPLAEVRDAVISQIRAAGSRERAKAIGEGILAAVRQGQPIEGLAQQHGVEWHDPEKLKRGDGNVHGMVVNAVFEMPRPQEGKPVFDGVTLPNGDYAVVGLYAVHDGDPAAVDAAARKNTLQNLVKMRSSRELDGFKQSLREQADVQLIPENF